MEVAPTTAQLIARAERAEKGLESTLRASEILSRKVQTTLDLLNIFNGNEQFDSKDVTRFITMYLRDALDQFDTWDELPF